MGKRPPAKSPRHIVMRCGEHGQPWPCGECAHIERWENTIFHAVLVLIAAGIFFGSIWAVYEWVHGAPQPLG